MAAPVSEGFLWIGNMAKFRLPINNALQLQRLLNAVETLHVSVPDLGVVRFNNRWNAWTEAQRKTFLMDIQEVVGVLKVLRGADINIEAEILE